MIKELIFIAEAGVNHNGSLKKALKLIDSAAYAGADYVKFQTYLTEELILKNTPKAKYQLNNTASSSSQYDLLKKLQLSYNDHYKLIDYAKKRKIKFLSSAFDLQSLEFVSSLNVDFIKIPSGEIDNIPYLKKVARFKNNTILSTGMSTMSEIKKAINILKSFGISNKKLTILQCNTEYPSPLKDANIKAMLNLQKIFRTNVGYSDHTMGGEAIYAAVALGASIIEKHFTLNKNDKGPDHSASASVEELKQIIETSRNIQYSLGSKKKKPTLSEINNIAAIRKKLIAAKEIRKGEIFTKNNLKALRSSHGVSISKWNKYIGKKSKKNYKINQPI